MKQISPDIIERSVQSVGRWVISGYQKLSWSKVVMEFQIIVETFVSIIFWMSKSGFLCMRTEEVVNDVRQQDATKYTK
jgi:hypothetical protein